jgi:hypothetical protein
VSTLDAILLLSTLSPATAAQLADTIDRHAARHHIDPLLIVALVHRESRFSRKARSGKNFGLMQVRVSKTNYPWLLRQEYLLYNPRVNIRLGVKLLAFWRWYCLTRCRHGKTPHQYWAHFQWGRKVKSNASAARVAETYGRLKR